MLKFFKKFSRKVEKEVDETEDIISGLAGFEERRKKPFYQQWPFWVVIIFVVALIVAGLVYLAYLQPVKNSMVLAQQVQTYFEQVQKDLLAGNFNEAKKDIQLAQDLLNKLEKNVDRLESPAMIGYLRNQYDGVKKIISAAQEFSDGLYLLTNSTQEVLSTIKGNDGAIVSAADRRQLLVKFFEKAPELNGARAQIDLSLIVLNEIETEKLNSALAEYVKTLKLKMETLRGFLDQAVGLSQSLPSLLGLGREKNYLFLLENNNELRPTGGFIGTLGILSLKDGKIISLETKNVYDYDKYAINKLKIAPPEPIKKYLNVQSWYLRDSNWSPDFAEAAKKIEWFYHQEAQLSNGLYPDRQIDGLIAITPKVASELLGVLGAVEVDSFVFNKDNFVDRLQYLVEVGYQEQDVAYFQRKDIIGKLGEKLISRVDNLNFNGWLQVMKLLFNNLNEKHILVYTKDAVVQSVAEKENWGGAIKGTADDYLLVVDANLAALKSNQCVTREIKYNLVYNQNKMTAQTDIIYKNNCSFTWKSTRYRTYTRLYVPLGAQLLKTVGAMEIDRSTKLGKTDVSQENGKTVFGAFIAIEPGQTGTLSFEYQLPEKLVNRILSQNEYNFLVQKQAGTLKDKLTLNITLPEKIKTAYPGEARTEWGDKKYVLSTDLELDREFKVGF